MTFSKFHEHSSLVFRHLNIVKLPDLVFLNIVVFMHNFHNRRLPLGISKKRSCQRLLVTCILISSCVVSQITCCKLAYF